MASEDVLEESGLLLRRWRFSNRALSLKSSIIREILKDSTKPGVINLAGGLPAPELFPIDGLIEACTKALKVYGSESLQYSLTKGVPVLREYLAERVSNQGVKCSPDQIQITGGSQQALDVIGRVFLEPGSVVLTESPTYLGAIQAFSFYDARFVSVKTDNDGMVPDDLEKKIVEHKPTIIYVVPNFQNPTGITTSASRRLALVALVKKYDVPIVEDNAYSELRYHGEALPSLKSLGGEHVIQVGSFSKLISPGLRIGWLTAEPEIIALCERMKQACDLHTTTFTQYVAYEFCRNGGLEKHIEKLRQAYGRRRDVMIEALRRNFSNRISWTEPEGGLFLWLKLPRGASASDLLPEALKAGVAYVPGKYFFSEEPDDSTLRLNFCNAAEANILEGIKRLASVIKHVI